jgi:2-polyprenyl-3-methyl-5-hydroxy-6-metoxy-1,4-benzoquinol methylase
VRKPFIDFYTEIGFAPTQQQSGSSAKHWQNRTNLYRKLGLHPRIFENTNVLEVGPGSGENSIDLLNRGISSLKLSDALPKVLESLQEKISTKIPTSYEIHDASVAYTNHDTFEIVICEGVIPLQMDPAAFFLNICSRVKPGGILLITTFDSISGLAEVLRRVISAPILQRTKNSKQATVEELTKLFHEDFNSLGSMTRHREDWVLDSILNPWVGKTFSIEDAIKASPEDFRPISMTPNLHLDQHWYKSYFQNQVEKNSWINSYKLNCHQLLDFRIESKIPSDIKSNTRLQRVCEDIFVEMQHLISYSNPRKNNHLGKLVEEIINECPQVDILTKNSLKSFADYSRNKNTSVLEDFRPFWGRGQQYLCFEKEKNN